LGVEQERRKGKEEKRGTTPGGPRGKPYRPTDEEYRRLTAVIPRRSPGAQREYELFKERYLGVPGALGRGQRGEEERTVPVTVACADDKSPSETWFAEKDIYLGIVVLALLTAHWVLMVKVPESAAE
jgi:hypothetical protein